jgi:tetratricopeptide (TPR) repeat protein
VILIAVLCCVQSKALWPPIDAKATDDNASIPQLIAQARAAMDRGDMAQERTALEHVLKLDPTHKQARLALTQSFMRLGDWDKAEDQAKVLVTQFPDDSEPVFLLSMIAMRRGDPSQAKDLAARCVTLGDTRPEVYKILALSEYLVGNTDQFEKNIWIVIERAPHDAEAQYLLARYLFEVKRYSESLKLFQSLLQIQPDHYKAHYYVGLLYVASSEPERARVEFEASIKIVESKNIAYAWPFADLARVLNDAGETGQAIDCLSRGLHNDPKSPRIHYEYARCLFQQRGATADVKQALLKAIGLDPGYSEAYYLLARYYRKSGENQAATQILAKFRGLKSHPIPSPYGLPRQ